MSESRTRYSQHGYAFQAADRHKKTFFNEYRGNSRSRRWWRPGLGLWRCSAQNSPNEAFQAAAKTKPQVSFQYLLAIFFFFCFLRVSGNKRLTLKSTGKTHHYVHEAGTGGLLPDGTHSVVAQGVVVHMRLGVVFEKACEGGYHAAEFGQVLRGQE